MKKIIIPCLLFFLISGCSANQLNIDPTNISQVTITSLPIDESLQRVYTDDVKINALCSYLNSLNLISHFTEQVEDYVGQTFIITINDNSGDQMIIYHFDNVFIKQNDNEWKKISYKQGSELYSLILKFESDK